MAAEREKLVSECAALSAKLEQERADRAVERESARRLAVVVEAEREKIAMELAAERGKTLVVAGQVDDLKAQVRHLADLSQQQQLDIEWMTGLSHEGVPPPSILRRRRQRVG